MKISNKIVSKFQEGGAAPAAPEQAGPPAGGAPAGPQGGAPAEGGGEDPVMQLQQMAMQALQGQDCQAAMAVCEGFISLLQGAQGAEGGGQAPPEEAPVYRKGGVLVRKVKN